MDVLDSSIDYSRDGVMHLLRDTRISKTSKQKTATEFCGISLSQRRFCFTVYRARSRTTFGLVAIWSVHSSVRERNVPASVCPGAAFAPTQFSCGSALSAAVEHSSARGCTLCIPLHTACDH